MNNCASILPLILFDSTERTLVAVRGLIKEVVLSTCWLRITAPENVCSVTVPWLYLQTAATQLMVGCMNSIESAAPRTGGSLRVVVGGDIRTLLKISFQKSTSPVDGTTLNKTSVEENEVSVRQIN